MGFIMATRAEKKSEYIKNIQNNINRTSIAEDERYFLESSSQFRPLLTYGILVPNDKIGVKYLGYWLKLVNGSNWHIKITKEEGIPDNFYREIINERIARAMGLNPIQSRICKYTKDSKIYCLMSEDYRKDDYHVITGKEIVLDYLYHLEETGYFKNNYGVDTFEELGDSYNVNSLPIIYQALNFYFSNRCGVPVDNFSPKKSNSIADTIYFELKNRYVYSYLTMQRDFHLDNFEILVNDHGAYLSPMYDLELSLSDEFYNTSVNTSLKASIDGSLSIDEDFQTFINASLENRKLVERMHYIVNPKDVMKFMEKMNSKDITIPNNIKKEVLESFGRHYVKVDEMLNRTMDLKK